MLLNESIDPEFIEDFAGYYSTWQPQWKPPQDRTKAALL